jgi:formylglycine-generating enzyme required for sulfatase activity
VKTVSHPYADALRLMTLIGCTETVALQAVGFQVDPPLSKKSLPPPVRLSKPAEEGNGQLSGNQDSLRPPLSAPPLRLLAPVHYESFGQSTEPVTPRRAPSDAPAEPSVMVEERQPRPPHRPLRRWGSLHTEVKRAVGVMRPSRRVDESSTVRVWLVHGHPCNVVYRTRYAWPSRLLVARYEAAGCAPVMEDHDWLVRHLRRELPAGALSVESGIAGTNKIQKVRLNREDRTKVLVMDGGQWPNQAGVAEADVAQGRSLENRSSVSLMLPAPGIRRSGDNPSRDIRRCLLWSRRPRANALDSDLLEQVLELAAIPDRLAPGLLRDLTRLLIPGPASLLYELAVWNHPSFQGQAWSMGAVQSQSLAQLRARFLARPGSKDLMERVSACIRRWHKGSEHPWVWAMEVTQLAAMGFKGPTMEEIEEAHLMVTDLFSYIANREQQKNDSWARMALSWSRRLDAAVVERSPVRDVIRRGCLSAQRSVPNAELSNMWLERPGLSEQSLDTQYAPDPRLRTEFVLRPGRLTYGDVLHEKGKGPSSILAVLPAGTDELRFISRTRNKWTIGTVTSENVMKPFDLAAIRISPGRLNFENMRRPSWASNFGRDRFGLFADWTLNGVTQRFRWIPPGEFLMGSPDDEPGRWEGEGPQHRVTVPDGFWLGDTPVTQALWEAGGGRNKSEFKTPDRPVENVSWDSAVAWITQQRAAGQPAPLTRGGLRLPVEAEWEYACRAGTTTALWTGPITIRGENDAAQLDDIAWYGGNSGHEFDLKKGEDSSHWSQKQYPHRMAGMRRVALKYANPWGLFDMLGNVWEWCADPLRPYNSEGWVSGYEFETSDRADRVVRGGSWGGGARSVRAACRFAALPGSAWDNCGFRLARGHGSPEGAPQRQSAQRSGKGDES